MSGTFDKMREVIWGKVRRQRRALQALTFFTWMVLGSCIIACGSAAHRSADWAQTGSASAPSPPMQKEAAEEFAASDASALERYSENEPAYAQHRQIERQDNALAAASAATAEGDGEQDAENGTEYEPAGPTPDPDAPISDRTSPKTAQVRPLLIYEAFLGVAVFQVQSNLDQIEELAVGAGGYLVERTTNQIVVRVPAASFQASLEQIIRMGDVHDRRISAKDITAEYRDLEIRLKNAVAVRARLEKLLGQAEKVEEALEVEKELGRVTEEIERLKGRLKLLSELVAFSTITVQFNERTREVESRVELPFPWLRQLGLHHLLDL